MYRCLFRLAITNEKHSPTIRQELLAAIAEALPSSNGTIRWIGNQWQQANNGQYNYQGTDGNMSFPPYNTYHHSWWEVHPNQSSTGGVFANWCCQ